MSEAMIYQMEEKVKEENLKLLQMMYNEVDDCINDESQWEVKNFIESFMNEMKGE